MAARAKPDRTGTSPQAELIGRAPERSWVRRRLAFAAEGEPCTVIVEGPMGIGKSWLVHHVMAEQIDQFETITIRCHERLQAPYGPLLDSLIPRLIEQTKDLPRAAPFADLLTKLALDGETDRDGASLHAEIVRAIAALSTAACVQRPLLIGVDDLQWADEASLDALSYLVGRMSDAALTAPVPIAVLITLRTPTSDDLPTAFHRLCREPTVSRLPLTGLASEGVAQLLRGYGIDKPGFSDTVRSATDGNPLFITAVAQRYGEHTAEGSSFRLPDEMRDAVADRLVGLHPATVRALEGAAILAEPISVGSLATILDLDDAAIQQLLQPAIAAGVIEARPGIVFAHPMLRKATLEASDALSLAALHLRAASHQAEGESGASERARHLTEAGGLADASLRRDSCLEAGRASYRLAGWDEAARFLGQAIALDEECPESIGDFDLGIACWHAARSNQFLGRQQLASEQVLRAVELLDAAGAHSESLVAAGDTVQWSGTREAWGGGVDTADLERRIATSDDERAAARAMASLAQAYWVSGQVDEARETAAGAIARANAVDDPQAHAFAALSAAIASWIQLDLGDAADVLETSLEAATTTLHPPSRIAPLNRLAMTQAWQGNLRSAAKMANRALDEARSTGYHSEDGLAATTLMLVAAVEGDHEKAEEYFADVVWHERQHRYRWAAPLALPLAVVVRASHGYWQDAAEALETWRSSIAAGSQLSPLPDLVELWMLALQGNDVELPSRLNSIDPSGVATGRSIGSLTSLSVLVELAWITQSSRLTQEADPALAALQQGGAVFTTTGAIIDRLRAQAAVLEGRLEDAATFALSALDVAQRENAPREQALVLAVQAQIETARNGSSTPLSDQHRAEAQAIGANLGLRGLRRALGEDLDEAANWVEVARLVMFVDIVGSTQLTEQLGDREFRRRSSRLASETSALVTAHGGTMIDGVTLGDGSLATFGTVAAALDAAEKLHELAERTDLEVRVGIHAGDVIIDAGNVYGATVNRAARVCDRADRGTTLVSEAVRSMAAGPTQRRLLSAGVHSLKGVEAPMALYAHLAQPEPIPNGN